METSTWTPAVGDTFTYTSDWPWHVGDQVGTHVVVSRMRVTEVDDRLMRYERIAVLSEAGRPPMEEVWSGAEAGTTALGVVPDHMERGHIDDVRPA